MDLTLLLEMSSDVNGNRTLVGSRESGLTASDLQSASKNLSRTLSGNAVLLDVNGPIVPILLFGAAYAGVPYVPLNYRLDDQRLRSLVARAIPATVVVGDPMRDRLDPTDGVRQLSTDSALALAESGGEIDRNASSVDPGDIAVQLFTSGTTGEPKAAILRHQHLFSYVTSTVEIGGAEEDEATLVSVPPYHIASIATTLTSIYGGRRLVFLESFEASIWVETARNESVTHAMVVPTMLSRIISYLDENHLVLPALRHLSYGGGSMPVAVIERALHLLPSVEFVNAYGLTETASTISILGPDDHREAARSSDPVIRARLGSVGIPLPSVDIDIRDEYGISCPAGAVGEIWVRGDQVAGEYREKGSMLDAEGWFPTKDQGFLRTDGFLFLEGRLDDIIVRGGENISPGEIEVVLLSHPSIAEAAVVGIPDDEWGETVAAAVVLRPGASIDHGQVQEFVRARLRSACTPTSVIELEVLPYNDLGKLLRREIRAILNSPRETEES